MNPPHQKVSFAFLLALDVCFFFFKYWLLFELLAQCPQTHFSAVMEFSLTYRLQWVTAGKLSRFWPGREIVNDVHCHSLIVTSLYLIDVVSWGPGNIFIFKSFVWRQWIGWIDKVALSQWCGRVELLQMPLLTRSSCTRCFSLFCQLYKYIFLSFLCKWQLYVSLLTQQMETAYFYP